MSTDGDASPTNPPEPDSATATAVTLALAFHERWVKDMPGRAVEAVMLTLLGYTGDDTGDETLGAVTRAVLKRHVDTFNAALDRGGDA